MSSEDSLGRDPAPSSIRYLVLLSAFTSLLTGFSFIPKLTSASSQELEFFQVAIPAFTFFSIISFVEWFLLGRSRKMIGPYGFAFGVEIIKTIYLSVGASFYVQMVDGASSSTFLLSQFTTLAILFMLALTKVARTKLEELTQKNISRNLLNLLPTILVLTLFLGTYITEIAGLGTPRHRSTFDPYTEKEIDWSMFNTPTWDASYLLENLLDQFTAGLSAPDTPLFNVSSDQADPHNPLVYWRLGTLEKYEYTDKTPYSTDWNPLDSVKRVLSPVPVTPNTTYSNIILNPEASFIVRLPLNYNDSIADITVHPNFVNYLPSTWNGEKGSYISSNSFRLYETEADADNQINALPASTTQVREVFPNAFADDHLGNNANLRVDVTSSEEGFFEYTMDYKSPDFTTAAAFSTTEDQYDDILGASWNTIQNIYLQYPNTTSEIPQVGNLPLPGPKNNYVDWAPNVVAIANEFASNLSSQTVARKAFTVMQDVSWNGSLGFEFDTEMWLGNQVGVMARPAEYEDFNEWFFNRKEGVSLHFASLYTTIMRIMGIPSRVVIGYIGGNDSINTEWRVITSRYLHAWSEVLIPIDTLPGIPGGERVEWVTFDPVFGGLLPDPFASADKTFMFKADYDLETNGIAVATLYDAANKDTDWLFSRTIISNSTHGSSFFPNASTIVNGTTVDVSVRIINVPGGITWSSASGATVTFSIGLTSGNVTLGTAVTDGQGIASLSFTHDIAQYGILQPVIFYAEATFKQGEPEEFTIYAYSYTYILGFL